MNHLIDIERDEILRREISKAGLGGILAWYPEDITMTCGSWTCLGIDLCLYPVHGTPVFFSPSNEPPDLIPDFADSRRFKLGPDWQSQLADMIEKSLKNLGIRPDEIGIAADEGVHGVTTFPGETPPLTHSVVTNNLFSKSKPKISQDLFTVLGLRKTSKEQLAIRRANEVAGKGLEAFYKNIRPGVSEADIAAAVEFEIHSNSGKGNYDLARGWAHVQGGENIYLGGTFSRSSGNVLKEGDLVIIELATCVDGYWSDLTRTAAVGQIDDRKRDLLSSVKEAQKSAINAIRPGISHEEVYAVARKCLAEKQIATGFTHNCGHHVGFRYHDRGPTLITGNPELIEEGMILTVEPGTYGEQFGGGARFEDNVLVTKDGVEILSPINMNWNTE
jgi:Xaa-Pro dipeptidase